MTTHVLAHWNPEDAAFWESEGRAIASRNLWISIPSLTLAFAVWMVWSVVVVNLPNVGFKFSTEQLFWLAALPSLCGATLRIFYSFMVPIFGGRRWTAISTASLLLPAIGIGFAVQGPVHQLFDPDGAGAAVRFRRRQLRLEHGQHQFLFPEGAKGNRARSERGPGQPRRVAGAVRGAAGDYGWRVRRARRRAPGLDQGRRGASRCGCRTPASSGFRSSRFSRSRRGSA